MTPIRWVRWTAQTEHCAAQPDARDSRRAKGEGTDVIIRRARLGAIPELTPLLKGTTLATSHGRVSFSGVTLNKGLGRVGALRTIAVDAETRWPHSGRLEA
jgi:hypothetical protein